MADFVQTMKDWRRMCKAYTTDDESCCDGCPVVNFHEHGCGAIFEMDDSTDWKKYADAIREWAEEHPEPVYPTWGEWLESIGVIKCNDRADSINYLIRPTHKTNTQIPADIAQKLGIAPKEG